MAPEITDIPINTRSISYRWDGTDFTLVVDETNLTIEWNSPTDTRSLKLPLRELRSDFPIERWISAAGKKRHRYGLFLAAAAAVVFFSDIPQHIPLLAPALLVLGLTYIYLGFRAMLPLTKTTIRTKAGRFVTAIPHFEELREKRPAFEALLNQMVRHARQDEPKGQ